MLFQSFLTHQILHSQHFQNKVAEIRGETKFWGGWGWVPVNPTPPPTKLGGDAPACSMVGTGLTLG